MNLFKATHILKSVGYHVEKDLNKQIDETLDMVLESMENRGAVHTQAYRILAEMAIKKPKKVTDDNPWNEYDERFSKLQGSIQSKMTRGGDPRPSTKQGWIDELNAIADHLSNPACRRELPNLQSYLNGDTDMYTSANPNNTGILSGNFKQDRKNISSSISTLGSHGGKNYEAILARIDELEASCGEDVTDDEANAIEKLRQDLETARIKAEGHNAAKGKTAIFRPAATTPVALSRIKFRLNNVAKATFTENEDGTITITSKVAKAKEALAGMGEFVEPQAQTAAAEPTELTFDVDAETAEFLEDIANDAGATITNDEGIVTITGTKHQLATVKANIQENLPELLETPEAAEAPVEEAPTVIDADPIEDDTVVYEAPEDEEIEDEI